MKQASVTYLAHPAGLYTVGVRVEDFLITVHAAPALLSELLHRLFRLFTSVYTCSAFTWLKLQQQ